MTRAPPSRTVWARIKEALRDKGLPETQVYAAKLIGIEQPSVSDWNKPGMCPAMDNAVTLAKKLGICVEWLITERGPKHPGPPGDPILQELLGIWEFLPPKVKRDLLGAATIAVAESTGVFPKEIAASATGEHKLPRVAKPPVDR